MPIALYDHLMVPDPEHKRKRHDDIGSRIGAMEQGGFGTLPSELVYAGAMSSVDDRESAERAMLISRYLQLPSSQAPSGRGKFGKPGLYPKQRKPKQLVDPYTGDGISLSRANQLFTLGTQLSTVLSQQAPYRPGPRGRAPIDPKLAVSYVQAMGQQLGKVDAALGVQLALDMSRTGTDPTRFANNLAAVADWNDRSQTITDEEALFIAKWWSDNQTKTITPGDIVALENPEISNAITDLQQQIGGLKAAATSGGLTAKYNLRTQLPALEANLNDLLAQRQKIVENPNYANEALRFMNQMQHPSWMDNALGWGMHQLDNLWHVTQHIAVDVSFPFESAFQLGLAAAPGGMNYTDAIHRSQEERSYLIQRINGGDSLGMVFSEAGYMPRYLGAAYDFLVGVAFDPTIIGLRSLGAARQLRTLPGTMEASTVGRLLTPSSTLEEQASIRSNIYTQLSDRFATGSMARRIYDSMYRSEGDMFAAIDRLATHFEARSPLEYRFMQMSRDALLERYPTQSAQAFSEFSDMLRAHTGMIPPEGSLAADVVSARMGTEQVADQALVDQAAELRGYGLDEAASQLADTTIERAVGPLFLRNEIPHTPLGLRTRFALRFGESALGETSVGRASRELVGVNPGNVLNTRVNPEQFIYERGNYWGEFTDAELRAYQGRIIRAGTEGIAADRAIYSLVEEMDREAMRRFLGAEHLDPGIVDDITRFGRTNNAARLNEARVFGVAPGGDLTSTFAHRPVVESELQHEFVLNDPAQVRTAIRRYKGTVRSLVAEGTKALSGFIPDEQLSAMAKAAYKSQEVLGQLNDGVMRTWKFMVVPRFAYIPRVILGDENLRFLATIGSVSERLTSFELKGLGRLLDDSGVFDETVRVGGQDITIRRAGTYGYEPLANQQFRVQDAVDDMLRSSNSHMAALSSDGNWGVITGDMPQHLGAWARVLNYQLGNSVPGQVALRSVEAGESIEQTAGRLAEWARSRAGWKIAKTSLGLTSETIPEWSDFLSRMTHSYTLNDATVARGALARAVESDTLNALVPDAMLRPTVHGPLMVDLTQRAGWGKWVDNIYNWMVRQPESTLNRQPYYRAWYRRATRSYYQLLGAQGLEVTDAIRGQIDAAARDFSLAQVNKVMFDFTRQTRIGELINFAVPFVQPWAEAYTVWGHILVNRNPALIGYVNYLGRAATESGFLSRDPDSNQLVIPWSWFSRAASWLPFINPLPPGVGLVAPLANLNLFLSQTVDVGGIPIPLPSLTPWVGAALQRMFTQTTNPYITSYLFSHGYGTSVIPSYLERGLRAIFPEHFLDSRDQAQAMNFLRLYQYLGTDRDENGNLIPAAQLRKRALADANNLNRMLAVTGFFGPTAGQTNMPQGFQDREQELKDLQNQYGYSEGTDIFTTRHPELSLFTIGKTMWNEALGGKTTPRIPATEVATQLLAQPGFAEFSAKYPAWASAIILASDAQWSDSSLETFSQQVYNNQVRYKSLTQFQTEGQERNFWDAINALYSWYTPQRDALQSQGLATDNEAWMAMDRARNESLFQILMQYPEAAKANGIVASTTEGEATWTLADSPIPPAQVIINQLYDVANAEGFQQFPAIQGLRAYTQLRDALLPQMRKLGVSDIRSTTAERLGLQKQWEDGRQAILDQFPEAAPFIVGMLSNDLIDVRSKADFQVDRMSKQNPDKYAVFVNYDTRLEALNDATREQQTPEARTAAFNAYRQYVADAYATGKGWAVRLWFDRKSPAAQQVYMDTLRTRAPAFYSRLDWELMGVKLTDKATTWLGYVTDAQQQVRDMEKQYLLEGKDFPTGQVLDQVDAWVKSHLKQSKSFATAVAAMNTWGWGVWHSDLVDQPGKAGWAWQHLRDITVDLNEQVQKLGLLGVNYGSQAEKTAYAQAREALAARIQEYAAWSPVFAQQVKDIQEDQLGGDPFAYWLMPDNFFPLGVTS